MPYVARDAEGKIVAVAAEPGAAASEPVEAGAPELQDYLARIAPRAASELASTDLGLIRVIEDLVDTLMDKNVLRFTDLPEAAQHKLTERRSLRKSLNPLNLFGDPGVIPPEIKL